MIFGKKSILKNVILAYLAFGLAMGLIFPVYADFFVDWKPGLKIWFSIGCIIAGIILGISNFVILRQIMLRPMNRISEVANQISNKDVTHQCSMVSHDTLGKIIDSFNRMAQTLRDMVRDIAHTSQALSSSASSMSDVTYATREGAELQKSMTEQVSDVVSTMNTTTHEVVHSVSNAREAANNANSLIINGASVSQEAEEAMQRIKADVEHTHNEINKLTQSSEQIGSVVDVIRGIAEQTNLLALNAAIEAARAGEQGRGFAVVADEVRNLANQTQKSTEEITEIIHQLQQDAQSTQRAMSEGLSKVDAGVESTRSTHTALQEMTAAIEAISQASEHIEQAVTEQSSQNDEVVRLVHEIKEISERTLIGAQSNTAECDQFNELAKSLNEIVKEFKV
ncbi:MAG: methyl-accepting chemotaxis protein [Gammaproteobacteria bacterium]|nr:methyl-accepting chemotaxis protein [Gammaproteobacteria bacterium]